MRATLTGRPGALGLLVAATLTLAAAPTAAERLEHVGSSEHPALQSVVGLEVSPDGKHLYAAAFAGNVVIVYQRDEDTGELRPVHAIQDAENLDGVTSITLSPDGRLAVAAAFRSGTVVLYERDEQTGRLTQRDVARDGEDGGGFGFAVLARFSPDGRHVYAIDGEEGGVAAFAVTEDQRLRFVQAQAGPRGAMVNSRGLAMIAEGETLAVTNAASATVGILERDTDAGSLRVRQLLRHGHEARSLRGVFGVAASDDGSFLYTCSGRFGGDHAVTVFARDDEGRYVLEQELINGQAPRLQADARRIRLASAAGPEMIVPLVNAPPLHGFVGGNVILVSPDGRHVYATATVSGSLAAFARDEATGRLRHIETRTHGDDEILAGAAGLVCSPDGRFLYVAAEEARAITIYRRPE